MSDERKTLDIQLVIGSDLDAITNKDKKTNIFKEFMTNLKSDVHELKHGSSLDTNEIKRSKSRKNTRAMISQKVTTNIEKKESRRNITRKDTDEFVSCDDEDYDDEFDYDHNNSLDGKFQVYK